MADESLDSFAHAAPERIQRRANHFLLGRCFLFGGPTGRFAGALFVFLVSPLERHDFLRLFQDYLSVRSFTQNPSLPAIRRSMMDSLLAGTDSMSRKRVLIVPPLLLKSFLHHRF